MHCGMNCNPCNWDGRNWMPMMVGDPKGPMLDKFDISTSLLDIKTKGIRP